VFVENCYVLARSWGHSWRDFMDLPIPMWWLEFDQKVRESRELEQATKTNPARQKSGLSSSDWIKAHRRHKERMKNG
jgi:hypothetical protein